MNTKHETPSLHKATDPVEHICQICDKQFYLVATDKLVCPYCNAMGIKFIVPVTESELLEEEYERG